MTQPCRTDPAMEVIGAVTTTLTVWVATPALLLAVILKSRVVPPSAWGGVYVNCPVAGVKL